MDFFGHGHNTRALSAGGVFYAVALCVGAVVCVLMIGVFLRGHTAHAATAVGDAQGVPPGYTGQPYPAPTTCWDYSANGQYNYKNPGYLPCQSYHTYGILSASPQGTSQGVSVLLSPAFSIYTTQTNCGKSGCNRVPHYSWSYPESVVNTQAGAGGASINIVKGKSATLQWSCQSIQSWYSAYCGSEIFNTCQSVYYTSSSLPLSGGATAGGPGFSGGTAPVGSATVSPANTTTYSLTCGGAGADSYGPPAMSVTVNVTAPPPPPVPTCTLSASSPVVSGNSSTLSYTTAGSPTDTVITDSNGDTPIHPSSSPVQSAPLQTTNGSTAAFTMTVSNAQGSSNCQATAIVTASSTQATQCTGANETGTPPNCTCVAGYVMQGGSCVLQQQGQNQCPGAHESNYPTCSCDFGYVMQNGSCVLAQCPGAHESNYPTCSCDAGYSQVQGQCILTPTLQIQVNNQSSVRVQKGNTVGVTWSASGVAAGSCSVTDTAGGTVSQGQSSSPTPAPTVSITQATVFTLACTDTLGDPVSVSASAGIIPSYIEQ